MKAIKDGTPVRFTLDNLGILERIGDGTRRVFLKHVVAHAGQIGTYWRPDPVVDEDGWHLVLVVIDQQEYVVPVHESMFEVV